MTNNTALESAPPHALATQDDTPQHIAVPTEPGNDFANFQKLIRLGNAKIDDMPPQFKIRYQALATRIKPNGDPMTEEEFAQESHQFIENLKRADNSPLDDKQRQSIQQVEETIQSGQMQPKEVVNALREFTNNNAESVGDLGEANEALNALEQEIDLPPESRSPKFFEGLKKLLKVLKYVGLALVALLGFGIFKGAMSGRGS